jgi:hypothetical protein
VEKHRCNHGMVHAFQNKEGGLGDTVRRSGRQSRQYGASACQPLGCSLGTSATCNYGRCEILKVYAPQTKILEAGTKDVMRIFDLLFTTPWPKSSTHALEKCFLRKSGLHLLFLLPKSSFGEHKLVTTDHSIRRESTHRIVGY